MATNYEVNYDDERFTQVETDKQNAMSEIDNTYDGMIGQSDEFFDKQIQASKDWAATQSKNQQERTDFTIDTINQQKEQANKDYIKEQSGAYVDWQKQSNQYGANAEAMAAQGMKNTGYSESSQVSMYNTYQNRLATARETYNRAVLNYDNAIKDAQLQNNAALAETAYQALQQQLELGLQGFQYKNTLILDKANQKIALDNTYYGRYQDVVNQINTENSMAEQVRQYNESLAEEQRQFNETMAYNKSKSSGGSGGGGGYQVKGSKTGTRVAQNTEAKSNSKSEASVMALGYGPISADELEAKQYYGEVIETVDKDGNIIFKRANSTGAKGIRKGQETLDKYTMLRL